MAHMAKKVWDLDPESAWPALQVTGNSRSIIRTRHRVVSSPGKCHPMKQPFQNIRFIGCINPRTPNLTP